MRVGLALVGMLMVAAAAGCGGGARTAGTPATHETPVPAAMRAPVGPLLAYVADVSHDGSFEQVLRVYDAGAGRPLRELSLAQGAVVALRPTTDEVVYVVSRANPAAFASPARIEIHTWSASTGDDRVLYSADGSTEWSVALSPDGAQLAFTLKTGDDGAGSTVYALTIATGEARPLAVFGDPVAGDFRGVPVPRAWRADGGGVLVTGDTASGAPGSWATVRLDGTVAGSERRFGWPSPDGRWLADAGVGEAGCVFGVQRLEVWDMDAGAASASVADAQRGIVLDGWSPDGESVLYREYAPKTLPKEGECVPDYDQSTERAYLLSVHGGASTPVADIDALHRAWNRGHDVTFVCDAPSSSPGAAAPTPDVFDSCPFGSQVLTVDGASVSARVERVLGFLDTTSEHE